jgi:C4-dicarboxylate-specific signal transduction histidine kinase
MNVAAKNAASLARETPYFGSNGDIAIILSTKAGSDDGDDSDDQEAEQTDGFDGDGGPYQPRTYFLMVFHHGHGAYSTEAEGYGEGHGEDGVNLVMCHHPPDWMIDQDDVEDAINGRAVLPTIESIENTPPSHLDAIGALAASGEWAAVRDRTDKQIQRLEFLSARLVKDVARNVEEQRTQTALNIARVERRIVFTAIVTGFVTLFTAAFFGWATALRIIELQLKASTERKQAEEALRQAHDDLARANRVSSMGELTASLAHEVNQPIAASILNANSCLRWLSSDHPDLEEARAAASRVVQDGRRAGEIVKRVHLLFKKDALQQELVDLNEIIREMVLLLSSEATQFAVSLRAELAAGLPQVMGDRVQLQQVLMNLMMNGIDAMKDVDGTRELTIQSQRREDGQVLVSVSDTGVGLPPQQEHKIFNAFFTTKAHGTGMGLRISRSIVESHGGRLWAVDSPPRGARFCFTLPMTRHTTQSCR